MKVLVVGWDSGGGVEAVGEVVRKVVARGHVVTVLAPEGLRARFEAVGAAFRPYRFVPDNDTSRAESDLMKDWQARTRIGQMARLVDRVMLGPAPLVCRDVREALAEEDVDVVLVDGMVPAAHCAAEAAGVPSVHLLHSPRADLGRWRDRAHRRLAHLVFRRGMAPLNQARRELGLEPATSPFAPVARARRVLVCSSPTFDFGAPPIAGIVRYVGPQLDEGTTRGDGTDPWDWAPDGPRVLVGLSTTFMDQERLLRTVIRALAGLPLSALVTTGSVVDPATLPSSANVRVVPWVRHADALRRCSAVITHGGHGTVLKALGAGVPLVVSPQGRDQPANAARVTRLGSGIRVSPKPGVGSLRRAVRRVLDDDAYGAAARRFARRLVEERCDALVVDEVEWSASTDAARTGP